MGLQSALTTALTGLQAAETVIDVVGNNVANSSTVGFKESDVLFATQFLQTQSIGSAPTDSTGGSNPRQIGLGVKVAAINPDFTQGTIEISSNPLDMAIQGDGFLIVQGSQGEQLYTRNGQLQTNAQNEIVTVTGNRLLGFGVNEDFEVDSTTGLVPLTIPVGSQIVAQATENAFFSGNLNSAFEVGTSGEITSQALGDATVEFPTTDALGGDFDSGDFQIVSPPDTSGSSAATSSGGTLSDGDFLYRVTWFVNSGGNSFESAASTPISHTLSGSGGTGTIDLSDLPTDTSASPIWDGRRIYRSTDGGATFEQLGPDLDLTTDTFSDDGSLALGSTLDDSVLDQQEFSYYVTFFDSTSNIESRPTDLVGPFSITDTSSRIRIDDLPQPAPGSNFDRVRIYRNIDSSTTDFHLVDELTTGTTTYIDSMSDADIEGNPKIDLLGARASNSTLLTDVTLLVGGSHVQPFEEGTLRFTGTKGDGDLATKELEITSATTVNDLRNFMVEAYGIDISLGDGAGGVLSADGELVIASNPGIENEVGVRQGSFVMDPTGSDPAAPITFDFTDTETATGEGTTTTFQVFDSLGEALDVRLTTVKEEETPTSFTYRWFATSPDNEPTTGVSTFLDSGTITFDRSNGTITDPPDGRASIALLNPAEVPLVFTLDFSAVTGLAQTGELSLSLQDGFAPGSLTSFEITDSGLIRGVFSNGAERALGQVRMARFANDAGLEQIGNNLYGEGINSGEPIISDPGQSGVGTLTAGAVELSNSDIGQNLIELILASTQFRGGSRVITTSQQLLDELLNLRR